MAATELLQEFLVSVRYGVDAASQRSFLDGLKRMAGSVSGVAAEVVALSGAVIAFAEKMARAGEQLYFMGQRIGSTVNDIQAATFAMSQLGTSADDAKSSMESLGRFQRTYGPAATAYMRMLGVTATDTAHQMQQLGQIIGRMGPQGSVGYARGLAMAGMMGISENALRAVSSPEYQAQLAWFDKLTESINKAGGNLGRFGILSHQVMDTFRQWWALIEQIAQAFAVALFPGLNKNMQTMLGMMQAHMPQIIAWVQGAAQALTAFGDTIMFVVRGLGQFTEWIGNLDPMIRHIIEGFAGLKAAMWLIGTEILSSPFGWLLMTLGAIMLLLDDYSAWASGGKSAINWSFLGDFQKKFAGIKEGIDGWMKSIFGVEHGFNDLVGAASVLFGAWMLGGFAKAEAAVKAIGAAATSSLGQFLLLTAAIMGAGWLKGKLEQGSEAVERFLFGDKRVNERKKMQEQGREQFWRGVRNAPSAIGGGLGWLWHHTLGSSPAAAAETGGGGKTGTTATPAASPASVAAAAAAAATAVVTGGTAGGPGGGDPFAFDWSKYDVGGAESKDFQDTYGPTGMGSLGSTGGVGSLPGGGMSDPISPRDASANAVRLRDKIMAMLGVPANVAAGIVSNLMAESGGVSDIWSKMAPVGQGGYGLMQWAGSRRRALFAWAKSKGLDASKEDVQLMFMKEELAAKFPGLLGRMGGMTAEQAAGLFFDVAESGGAQSLMQYRPGHMAWARNVERASSADFATPAPSTPMTRQHASAGGPMNLHHQVAINLHAPDPHTGARLVADNQARMHEDLVRKAGGVLV
jgi:hypothetical protein